MENQNLMTLSQFAVKARKEIGRIKVADLMTDSHYATNLLIRSYFSKDKELIEIARKASNALDLSLMHAIEKYITFITSKGQNQNILIVQDYLVRLTNFLSHVNGDGLSYRKAINAFLKTLRTEERPYCLNLAREFFPFWIEVVKSVTSSSKGNLFNLISLNKQPSHKMLLEVWNNIDHENVTERENIPLRHYSESMDNIGIDQEVIHTRKKIAKIITKELRNHNETFEMNYRNAVNNTQYLFKIQNVKRVFICVSREFYYFCINHPEAHKFILYHERF